MMTLKRKINPTNVSLQRSKHIQNPSSQRNKTQPGVHLRNREKSHGRKNFTVEEHFMAPGLG